MGPIRVAHLLHTVAHGGVETAILNWFAACDRTKVALSLICFANPDESEKAFLRSAANAGLNVDLIQWNRWKPVRQAGRTLAKILQRDRIEVLHCHNTYANLVGLTAAKIQPVKTLTTFYVWGNLGFKRNVLQKIDQWAMKRFDRVTAHCQTCVRDTAARGIPEDQIPLLFCGYPSQLGEAAPGERDQLRRRLGAGAGDSVLLYLARFWPEKAHDHVLRSFRKLVDRDPRFQLWLPGDGPLLEESKALAAQLRLDPFVKFLGFRGDFESLLRAADLQIHPSDAEGVSLAICAGMAAGVPIIASRVGGLTEVLRDGKSAVLLPPRDESGLIEAVLSLRADPDRARLLGEEAQRFIREEYSLGAAMRRVEETYAGLVSRPALLSGSAHP